MKKSYLLTLGIAVAFHACMAQQKPTGYHAIDPANLDLSAKPAGNFYQFAVGSWVKRNPVPASKSAWSSFNVLYNNNRTVLHEVLLEAAASAAAKGSNTQKVGDFFKSGMDSVSRNKKGYEPINPYLQAIEAIKDGQGVLQQFVFLKTHGLSSVYEFGVGPDDKNSVKNIPGFSQSGLTLPDRDYYLKNDSRTLGIRSAFQKHVIAMLGLIGVSPAEAKANAADILALETKLAQASMDRVVMRDPYKTYHKFSPAGFSAEAPGIDWNQQIKALGIDGPDSILVAQPEFFKTLGLLLKSEPLAIWKEYLRWKMLNSSAGTLSDDFQQESFNFNGKVLGGSKVMELRWERLTAGIDRYMGEALGQEYVKKAFPPQAKARMLELIANLNTAFAERIQALDWMSPQSKLRALAKLKAIIVKVGYPDKWKDYSALEITPDNYFQNSLNARLFQYNYEISQYGKPVDKTIWGMSPPTVNAYYNPSFNEIVFPAGILQPPFFDFKADDAVNYGAIGAVIGHEMTHGFDDEGRQYDADGNLKDWWTKEDGEKFKARAEVLARQFDRYTVLDTVHVNGHLTLGENLADLGGTMIAYQAFKKTAQGKSHTKIDGFTPDQRFFLGYAQIWKINMNPEAAAVRIKTDPHAPGRWRVIGPLSDNLEFYKAFDVKPGDGMYRPTAERAKVW